ncbi:MAG: peptide chain release factor N(5)-glutamine methyltransferase [Verrucomicrobia bacterium]|nr:MAG: peptide chain release factor N(5)-glutamine methyltransferase [Verrucomicrobiota bacterium]
MSMARRRIALALTARNSYGARMDVSGELKRLTAQLKAAGRDEAVAEAESLLAHTLGCRRLAVYLHGERQLTAEQLSTLKIRTQRLLAGEPLQYVLGEVEFCGRIFACDKRALIPRPETELLVEVALGFSKAWKKKTPKVPDLGTGTGCLAITLALERPHAQIFAVDVSADALALARANAARHGVADKIKFVQADLLAPFADASLDLIVSNPPYVPTAEWGDLPRHIRDFEPRVALDAGPDGLDVLRRLIAQAAAKLALGGALALEIGEDQGRRVAGLLHASGFRNVVVHKDFAGWDRVVTGCL